MLVKAKSTRVNNAYERLKREILEGVLPPGYQAPEPDIANRLGMSRTPVREALIRLEAEGLVDLVPRRGARVVAITKKDIREIFEILAELEALAARKIAASDERSRALRKMGVILMESDMALKTDNIGAWVRLDDALHRLTAEHCGNERLQGQIQGLLDQVFRANSVLLRLNGAPAADVEEHQRLYEAFEAGDAELAADVSRAHRQRGLKTMDHLLQSSGLSQV